MSTIVTAGSAVLTTLLGVVAGAYVSSRTQRVQRSWDRQTDACAEILRESAAVLIALARLARDAAGSPISVSNVDWRPWNDALAMVSLVADHDVADAAHAIDEQIWMAHLTLTRRTSAPDQWFALRDAVEDRRKSFTEIARRRLDVPGPVPRRLHGRPDTNDPIWESSEPPSATA
ncbi:hypothetical protein [Streptomyces sp. NPDC091217]|uniref:hypothetical protein n=1 Tax=Streptomyces sp. NPDC091217 TaxID=3365975 RepID=UPI0037F43254